MGKSQTTFWINNMVAGAGQVIIPVYVTEFDSIATANLVLLFSPNLTYVGVQNVSSHLDTPLFNAIGNQVMFAAYSISCMSIPDSSIVFELKFNFTGGVGTFTWDPGSGVSSCGTNNINPTFINGYINTSIGINDLNLQSIRSYPNPTTDIINFTSNVKDFRLYNTYGQLLFSDKNVQTVDLKSFSKGVYIADMDNRITKIIKQ